MSEIASLVARAKAMAETASTTRPGADDRAKIQQLATEFESTLLVQVLRDMRKSGSWGDGESKDGLGAESLYDTLDVELARHLSEVQGFGLAKELTSALERLQSQKDGNPTVAVDTPSVDGALMSAPFASAAPIDDDTSAEALAVPLASGRVTSGFGWRQDPFTGQARFHRGVDLRAAYGQEVQAAAAGRVVFSGEQSGYGTTVVIEHDGGTRTRYAHLSAALVHAGDQVGAGFAVGRAGHSGRATGTHLHFEVTAPDGSPVAPALWSARSPGAANHG